jgi:hypothetical protein
MKTVPPVGSTLEFMVAMDERVARFAADGGTAASGSKSGIFRPAEASGLSAARRFFSKRSKTHQRAFYILPKKIKSLMFASDRESEIVLAKWDIRFVCLELLALL